MATQNLAQLVSFTPTSGITANNVQQAVEQAVVLSGGGVGKTLDLTQSGDLQVGTIWGIDASAPRSRALPSAPNDGDEIRFYVRGNTGDIRNNNATVTVSAPDSVDGGAPGASFVFNNTILVDLKYNATDQNWELINDSLPTGAGDIINAVFRVTDVSDTGNIVNILNSNWQRITLTANRDFTFDIKQGEWGFITVVPGAFVLSFTNVTEWVGLSAPSSIGAEALFLFWSDDGVAVSGLYIGEIG